MAGDRANMVEQMMFQAAQAKLDRTCDLLKGELNASKDQRHYISKATQTLEKASRILWRLVRKMWEEDDFRNEPRPSSKRRRTNGSLSDDDVIVLDDEPSEATGNQTKRAGLHSPHGPKRKSQSPAFLTNESYPLSGFLHKPPASATPDLIVIGSPGRLRAQAQATFAKDASYLTKSGGSSQTAARKLVRRAKLFRMPKPRRRPLRGRKRGVQLTRPAAKVLAQGGPTSSKGTDGPYLPIEEIDVIYKLSRSIPNFASRLMMRLFSTNELNECLNVYGRMFNQQGSSTRDPLDQARVNFIQQMVVEKAGSSEKIWKLCVNSMNMKIADMRRSRNRALPESRVVKTRVGMHAKTSKELKTSPFYAAHNLSYETINQLYAQSLSVPNFAKKLMLFLFDKAELVACHSVTGKRRESKDGSGRGLDPRRLAFIREIVEQNATMSSKLWQACIKSMANELNLSKLRKN